MSREPKGATNHRAGPNRNVFLQSAVVLLIAGTHLILAENPEPTTNGGEVGAMLANVDRVCLARMINMGITSVDPSPNDALEVAAVASPSVASDMDPSRSMSLVGATQIVAVTWIERESARDLCHFRLRERIADSFRQDFCFGWKLTSHLDISITSQNLLDKGRPEFAPSFFSLFSHATERSGFVKVTWRY